MGHGKRNWRVSNQEGAFTLNVDKGKANELYNLREDPEEKKDLISEHPQKAMELELELRRFGAGPR